MILLAGPGFGRRPAATCCAVLAVATAGCASAAAPPHPSARVSVRPVVGIADAPVDIRVSGVTPGATVTIRVTSTDATGTTFVSTAVFRADARGEVDVAHAAALSGSYTGTDPTGLLWSMQPLNSMQGTPRTGYVYAAGLRLQDRMPMTVSAMSGGHAVGSVSMTRVIKASTVAREDVRSGGLYGEYFAPPPPSSPVGPALLEFDGSTPGLLLEYSAELLASHGDRVLDLAYFGEPGLPSNLSAIPLEYFGKALEWLASQPGVDPSRIVVSGWSRGSEAALLLGVHYPSLVHAVIALTPSDVVNRCYPAPCPGPAWTFGGAPVPYTDQFDDPAPTDVPAAAIPVEEIRGPILMDCGQADARVAQWSRVLQFLQSV